MLSFLNDKSILITGANGLIGQQIVQDIKKFNRNGGNIELITLVRDKDKLVTSSNLTKVIEGDLSGKIDFNGIKPNFIIHLAAPTSSKFMIENPVETILSITQGTKQILELAKNSNTQMTVIATSMEVYGFNSTENKLKEEDLGYIDPFNVRSSYPESKRLTENLIAAYSSEYNVNACSARLSMTYGKTNRPDNRALWQFIRNAKKDGLIELATKGDSKAPITSLNDAINALYILLQKGNTGEAYNVANSNNYISIFDLATKVTTLFKGSIVQIKEGDSSKYPMPSKLNLDSSKIKELGWSPKDTIDDIIEQMIDCV